MPTVNVNLQAATQVFIAGVLLPRGSYQIEPSPLDPSKCRLTVVRSPRLPPVVLEAISRGPDGPVVDVSVFMSMPVNGGAAFVELQVTHLQIAVPQAAPAQAPEAS